ncbi:MAG: OmpA family protein [Deltaproteobacteria bacterium]|nr:OmpA family protein [Deltaproteobacteria bacterium]
MGLDLIELTRRELGPGAEAALGSAAGMEPIRAEQALGVALPAITNGITNLGDSPRGAQRLLDMARDAEPVLPAPGAVGNMTGMELSHLGLHGHDLVATVLGARAGGLAEEMGRVAGTGGASGYRLLSMVVPVAVGALGRYARAHGLDARDVWVALGAQGTAPEVRPSPAAPPPAEQPRKRARLRWVTAGLVVLLAAAVISLVKGILSPSPSPVNPGRPMTVGRAPPIGLLHATSITLPTGVKVDPRESPGAYQLAQAIAQDKPGPNPFSLPGVEFVGHSAELAPGSRTSLDPLVSVLQAYPDAKVRLDGPAQAVGNQAANQNLSQQRAEAVRHALIAGGIPADRIQARGRTTGSEHASVELVTR